MPLETDAAMERRDQKLFTWYIYDSDTESYTASAEETSDNFTMAEVIIMIGRRMRLSPKVLEVRRQKGMITVSFAENTSNGTGEAEERAFLNSAVITILENDINAEWFTFQTGDGAYRTPGGLSLELGEEYVAAPLKIGAGDKDEYSLIRKSIPYPGIIDFTDWLPMDVMAGDDATARKLCVYLYNFGNPMTNVRTLSELPQEYIIGRGLWLTPIMSTFYPEDENYHPELRPITAAVNDESVYLREHVEATVRAIFGDVPVKHRSLSKYVWYEDEGVYTPPHMGGGAGYIPILFGYENIEGVYTVDFAFVGMGLDCVYDSDGNIVPSEKVREYASKQSRAKAVIGEGADGRLILHSMSFSEQE